ncbi:tRNA 5-methylaminomethyl-2-thiouridine biosynthesis bifunctional protein MnmC [Rubritalea halochordaticola]|uniref:tRNA 5-methylaminomethyl-2-thiouridine biosynthesis bifunctional protein MnmC n=1 Tax=Rubritalea halochordaticola TaxID=714537 RepID=A0ABP9V9Q8_9BACT
MTKVDFLIVGQGLAGSALAMAMLRRGKKILMVDRADPDAASRVAAGLVTTLAGKGMNPAWRQAEYLPEAMEYYAALEERSGKKLFHAKPVLRLFADKKEREKFGRKQEEVSEWVGSADPSIDLSTLHGEEEGFEMARGGRLDTKAYLGVVRDLLEAGGSYLQADFDPADLELREDSVVWKDVKAERLILCQGYWGLDAGWLSQVQHRSAKGQMLTVRSEELASDRIINRNGWMVPLGDGLWRTGATYEWDELLSGVSAEGRAELEQKIRSLVKVDFEVLEHEAGVRPIVNRSQPIIGMHPELERLGFFNGLGSKGVITAPSVAEHFAGFLCGENELDPELDLNRVW